MNIVFTNCATMKTVRVPGVFVVGFGLMDLDDTRWKFIFRSPFANVTL